MNVAQEDVRLKTRNLTFKRSHLEQVFFFLVSPFLSMPRVILGIYNKNKLSLFLFALAFGLLSYLFVPNTTNDRARYYEMSVMFSGFSLEEFILYLGVTRRPDFLLHLLIFGFSKLGINVQFLFFMVTSFTVGAWLYIFHKVTKKFDLSKSNFFLFFLLVVLSISLTDLLSGTRFYFGSSFSVLGIFSIINRNRLFPGLFLIVLGVLTHFSAALFLPLALVVWLKPVSTLYYKLFVVSLVFLFIPNSFFLYLIQVTGIEGLYGGKIELYVEGEDFITGGIQHGSPAYRYIYLLSNIWSYIAIIFLLFMRRKLNHPVGNLVLAFFTILNIMAAIPTIHARYLLVAKFLFVVLIIISSVPKIPFLFSRLLLVAYSFNLFTSLIILRYNIIESYLNFDALTLVTLLLRRITTASFLT